MNYTGDKINILRKENNLSQEKLAEIIGVSRQTVYKWEYGIVQPSEENIKSLCGVFGVEYNYFYENKQNELAITSYSNIVKKILTALAVVLGIFIVIGLAFTVVLGIITLTPNKGFLSKNYDGIDLYHFVIVLIITLLMLVAETIIICVLYAKKHKCKPDVNL